ncbi:hypothetical protein, partial [Mitsuokella jalaludinii]|uniref:hypothetical protein n=1 Tax=Mitsuokella jalaludinii TaxID=187979 RepID=UPI0030770363
LWGKAKKQEVAENLPEICMKWQENTGAWTKESILILICYRSAMRRREIDGVLYGEGYEALV